MPWGSKTPDDSEAFDNFGATPYLTRLRKK
jgi:hypothetical protein